MTKVGLSEKVLVLGIDGMDPKTAKRLIEAGKMPNLKKFVEKGAGREDLHMLGAFPTITPPCWTTLATGAYPSTHGITCYWRQAPESLDAVVYNMDSRHCTAEQMWNVTTEAGKKTLVWHWPGSAWPPSSSNENLHVVDGTQPGSVNMGVAQLDWEKIIVASSEVAELKFQPRTERPAGVGCMITDIEDTVATAPPSEEDEDMMEIWYGDASRDGREIRTYVLSDDDTETIIGCTVGYDAVNSPLKDAEGWAIDTEGAKEFTILTSGGITKRPGLVLKNEAGVYDRVALYKNKKATEPFAVLEVNKMTSGILDTINKDGEQILAHRVMKVMELDPQGNFLKLWISNAMNVAQDMLWHPKALYKQTTEGVGHVPPVSLIGGKEADIVADIFEPSWDLYNNWQAGCLNFLIKENEYDVVFSHLHNIDCAGHQLWHLAKDLELWPETDEKVYQGFIDKFYEQTDIYLGEFLHLLDNGWTIMIVSDHGLVVGESIPPLIGEYAGVNSPVMEELGYTRLKRDAEGNILREVDWENTKAVQIRGNHIYINLKGRDANGIVDPADKYELEDEIISALYNYRDERTGKRVISFAMRNKDAVVLGVGGPESGDIIFSIAEGANRLHGDGLPTYEGYYNTTISPIFLAAGQGIKEGATTDRVIRQVDVTPTIAALLGLRMPAQCEGAPVYQILNEVY